MALGDTENTTAGNIRAFYPMIVVPGTVHILAPSIVNTIMKHHGFKESLGGLLQMIYFLGALIGTLLITLFMQRFSVKQISLSAVLLLSVSLLAASASPTYALLLFFFFFTGFANGILITIPGVYITGMVGEASPQAQNMLYGFFSMGIILGPILPGFIVRWGISWRWALAIPALTILPLAIPLAATRLERMGRVGRLSVKVIHDVISFNRTLFFGLLLALMLFAAAQSSVAMWLVAFLENEGGMVAGSSHLVLTAKAALITVGRWMCGSLSKKVKPFYILSFITAVSTILVFLAPLPRGKTGSVILYPLSGLFLSGIYPFIVGYAAWFPKADSSAVFTTLIAAGALGGAFFPYLIGLINQHVNPELGMSSIAILFLGIIGCLYWIKPHITEKR